MARWGRNPGDLRERIELQRVTLVSDGQGGATETWSTYATVWAEVTPKEWGERAEASQTQAQATATHEVTIRAGTRVSGEDRLLWGVDVLQIVSAPVDMGQRGGYLTFEAMHVGDVGLEMLVAGQDDPIHARSGTAAFLARGS